MTTLTLSILNTLILIPTVMSWAFYCKQLRAQDRCEELLAEIKNLKTLNQWADDEIKFLKRKVDALQSRNPSENAVVKALSKTAGDPPDDDDETDPRSGVGTVH